MDTQYTHTHTHISECIYTNAHTYIKHINILVVFSYKIWVRALYSIWDFFKGKSMLAMLLTLIINIICGDY